MSITMNHAARWDNRSAPGGATNTLRGLTHSLDLGKEGLAMKATRTCSIEGCEQPHRARGFCNRHWIRWRNHGDPLGTVQRSDRYRSLEHSFWTHVAPGQDPSLCWEWQGFRMVSWGYGQLRFGGRAYRAHRVSWELANGSPVPEGMYVLHSCDNPPCVNPSHLRVGTLAENMRDVAERGRQRGERNGFHKLTQAQVDDIRAAHARGASNASQARVYGVHPSTISLIVNHVRWAR